MNDQLLCHVCLCENVMAKKLHLPLFFRCRALFSPARCHVRSFAFVLLFRRHLSCLRMLNRKKNGAKNHRQTYILPICLTVSVYSKNDGASFIFFFWCYCKFFLFVLCESFGVRTYTLFFSVSRIFVYRVFKSNALHIFVYANFTR